MAWLHRADPMGEGQPSRWAGEFRAEGGITSHSLWQAGSKVCWENLGVMSVCYVK